MKFTNVIQVRSRLIREYTRDTSEVKYITWTHARQLKASF